MDGLGLPPGWAGRSHAFDFTIFLLIMVPIAQTFHVPLVEVTAVFTGRFSGCDWWAQQHLAGWLIGSAAGHR